MAKGTILDGYQQRFLEAVLKEPYLLKHFYWTGGTALAEFYLKHRESYDIDLFSEKEIHLPSINKFVSITASKLGAKRVTHSRFLGLHSYFLRFDKSDLKVDFSYYPFPRIDKRKKWRSLEVDSLMDMAVNKIQTLATKPRGRDFVDIYFILKKKKWSIKKLVSLAKIKFDWYIDLFQLGEVFMEVKTYKDTPKVLVPYDQKKMEAFYWQQATDLKKMIFKQ